MKFYQELTLIPNDEVLPYFLWSKVYTQIHIAFAHAKNEYQLTGFGVSFPQYRFEKQGNKTWATFGVKLRVFAQGEDELNKLNLAKWLERLTDYVHLKSVQPVPENHRHAIFKRYHASPSKEAIARRYAHRHSVDYQTSLQRLENYQPELIAYPFIELVSETSKKENNANPNFRLYIVKETAKQPEQGEFSSYGLGVNVPEF